MRVGPDLSTILDSMMPPQQFADALAAVQCIIDKNDCMKISTFDIASPAGDLTGTIIAEEKGI
jgi:hypothetical protein